VNAQLDMGVTGKVVQLPRRVGHDPELTYTQLTAELGVSKRYLQARRAEGMPSCGLDYAGRRRFRLSEVKGWLDARQERLGRDTLGDAPFTPRREATS
jgi:hypothetical protein